MASPIEDIQTQTDCYKFRRSIGAVITKLKQATCTYTVLSLDNLLVTILGYL